MGDQMSGIVRAGAAWLLVAIVLAACVAKRDLALGGDRYLISMAGNRYVGIGGVEQSFHRRAQEIAAAHGFDSYKVIEFRSGFEPAPGGGFDPFAKGTIQLYQSARNGGSTAPGANGTGTPGSGGRSTGTAFAVAPAASSSPMPMSFTNAVRLRFGNRTVRFPLQSCSPPTKPTISP